MDRRNLHTREAEVFPPPGIQLIRRVLPGDVLVGLELARPDVPLAAEEKAQLDRIAPGQRLSFSTARGLARDLARSRGVELGAIPSDRQGAPAWPRGIAGSFSYKSGWCAVALSLDDSYSSIGLDLDRIERPPEDAWDGICTPAERAQIGGVEPAVAVDLIWSAKEAFFKAQCPLTGWADLDPLDLEIEIDPEGRFVVSPGAEGHDCRGQLSMAEGWCAAGVTMVSAALR